jgi:hypothetical protein
MESFLKCESGLVGRNLRFSSGLGSGPLTFHGGGVGDTSLWVTALQLEALHTHTRFVF